MFPEGTGFAQMGAIDRQHVQLEALLETLRSRFHAGNKVDRSLVSLLSALAAHMQNHFEFEEADEYFAGLVHSAPRLASRVERLLQQHTSLLADALELVDLARKSLAGGGDTTNLTDRFAQLRTQLLTHEAAEKKLLHEAYSRDIGTQD